MTFPIRGLASQNWVVTPVPAATGVTIDNIADQEWLMTLSGVVLLDLQGSNLHDWRRETVSLTGEQLINGPMAFAITTYPIPLPDRGGEFFTGLQLQQSSLYAAVGSVLDVDTGGVDAGFAVDAWRPAPLASTLDVSGHPVGQMFRGVDIDVAVRNTHATLHRINYHMTLVGKIIFLAGPL